MDQQSARRTNSIAAPGILSDAAWRLILAARRGTTLGIAPPWQDIFAPIVAPRADEPFVIGQIGQSLDGRIATVTGHSHYINGPEAIVHLHRLRALVDAVIVGVGTALADDPQLTVRHVEGPDPARIVIDPQGRLLASARLLAPGARRLVVTRTGMAAPRTQGVEHVALATDAQGQLAPRAILDALGERGLRRILVEGGAVTLSRFLAAGALDRLHVVVAPLIIGSGPVGISLPEIDRLDQALRPPTRICRLGNDTLFDIELAPRR